MKKILTGIVSVLSVCAIGIGTAVAIAENADSKDKIEERLEEEGITRLLRNNADCTFTAGVNSPAESDVACSGVEVFANSSKAKFSYNGIVDLRAKENFIGFMFTPKTMGNNETDSVTITLTDVYDETNFITIYFRCGTAVGYPTVSYMHFNYNNTFAGEGLGMEYANLSDNAQYLADIESGKIKDLDNGRYYLYHPAQAPDYAFKSTTYGTSIDASYHGKLGTGRYVPASLYYDPDDRAIYANSRYKNWPDRYDKAFDFDNPYIVGSNTFKGFTTNEVYLSVDVEASMSGSHILLTEFGGVDMSEESLPMCAPKIGINYGGYDKNSLPYGVAGENASYPVFDSLAYTLQDGQFTVDEIYVFRGTEYIPVVGGRFATKKSGLYTIMYKATSASGYTASKQVPIVVKDSYETPLLYEISEEIPSVVRAGTEKVYLYDGKVSGGSGNVIVEKSLTIDGNAVELYEDGTVSYFVPQFVEGREFTYKLTYSLTDISGVTYSFTKEITVLPAEKPIFSSPYVPEAVRVGYATQFAIPTATYYKDGAVISVPVVVRVNGKNAENGIYKPTTPGDFTLEYIAFHPDHPQDEAKAEIKTYTVTALALLTGDDDVPFSSYFLADNFKLSGATSTSLTYAVNNEGVSSLTYANALTASNLSVETGVNGNGYFRSLKIVVSDRVDAEQKVEFELRNVSGFSVLYINGVRQSQTVGSFTSADLTNRLSIKYNNYDFTVSDAGNNIVGKVEYSLNGMSFNGFTSGEVYVTVETVSDSEKAELYLYSINGQIFSSAKADRCAPEIVFESSLPMNVYYDFGTDIIVPSAKAYDVFSDIASLNVTVTYGSSVIYTGNAAEDYIFKASQYGSYLISYTATDTNGRSSTKKLSVIVGDRQSPEITGSYTIAAQYQVGEMFTPPEITATDNYTVNVDTFCLIVTPAGEWKIVEDDGYTFTKAGVYFVRLCAMDQAMNVAYKEFKIEVLG